jgi:hypothetical protein
LVSLVFLMETLARPGLLVTPEERAAVATPEVAEVVVALDNPVDPEGLVLPVLMEALVRQGHRLLVFAKRFPEALVAMLERLALPGTQVIPALLATPVIQAIPVA